MARPTKLTPQVEAAIMQALRGGMTRTAAAESNGIPRETMSRWMARFVTFRHAVATAEAQAEVRATITLRQAGETDWRAALAWLERRRSADWGKVDRLEIVASIRRLVQEAGLGPEVEEEAVAEAQAVIRAVRHVGR
jgi:hypothetical protein